MRTEQIERYKRSIKSIKKQHRFRYQFRSYQEGGVIPSHLLDAILGGNHHVFSKSELDGLAKLKYAPSFRKVDAYEYAMPFIGVDISNLKDFTGHYKPSFKNDDEWAKRLNVGHDHAK